MNGVDINKLKHALNIDISPSGTKNMLACHVHVRTKVLNAWELRQNDFGD
jgi:hypothetical protein